MISPIECAKVEKARRGEPNPREAQSATRRTQMMILTDIVKLNASRAETAQIYGQLTNV